MIVNISECERLARRRLRYITPLNAGKVLAHQRYWSRPFLELYLDECDERIFHYPEDGYLLAQHAPELARRIAVGELPGQYRDDAERLSWRVRALAVWGSSCRAYGELTQAEAAYRLGFELCEDSRVDSTARGELQLRAAVLALTFNRRPQALTLVASATELFEGVADTQRTAEAHSVRSLILIYEQRAQGLGYASLALRDIDSTSRRGARVFISSLHNVAVAVSRTAAPLADQENALKLLRRLRKTLAKKQMSTQKLTIFWVEGLLLHRIGMTRLAEKRLSRAREGFFLLKEPVEFAACSVDLAWMQAVEGAGETEAIAADTEDRLREITGDTSLLELMLRWRRNDPGAPHRLEQARENLRALRQPPRRMPRIG